MPHSMAAPVLAFISNIAIGDWLVICFILPVFVALAVLWIWALIDAITHEPSLGNDKLIWILVVVLLGWVGALIYYFVRRPERIRKYGR